MMLIINGYICFNIQIERVYIRYRTISRLKGSKFHFWNVYELLSFTKKQIYCEKFTVQKF